MAFAESSWFMRDILGRQSHLGYCTNVHAGHSLAEIRANLERHAAGVRRIASPDQSLGIGLWLPHGAIADAPFAEFEKLRATLNEHGLYVFTMNGFPYGDFHAEVVKHAVYRPDWSQPERLEYTAELAVKLASLTAGAEGSISTLPIGWKAEFQDRSRLEAAAHALRKLAVTLHELHERLGHNLHVDLEPEPGCYLETSADVVAFFEKYLLHDRHGDLARRYIRVCHDVCHAAVMFESQREVFERYADAGIEVGKVQISSALCVPFDTMDEDAQREALAAYGQFVERRFLHQTVVQKARRHEGTEARRAFYPDLPDALASITNGELPCGEWRTHFHVPVFLDRIGPLKTTRVEIAEALRAARELSNCRHFEVETYAWEVLPSELRVDILAEGIARELTWVRDLARDEALE